MLVVNTILQEIKIKKKFINKIKNKLEYLNKIKNEKYNIKTLLLNIFNKKIYFVKYILNIIFSKTNTLLQVITFSGKLLFCCSAGNLNYKGKKKTYRKLIMQEMLKNSVSKLLVLKNQPLALHLKNLSKNYFWVVKMIRRFFFINTIQIYNTYPFNGCRKKKIRRKKFRTSKKRFFLATKHNKF